MKRKIQDTNMDITVNELFILSVILIIVLILF